MENIQINGGAHATQSVLHLTLSIRQARHRDPFKGEKLFVEGIYSSTTRETSPFLDWSSLMEGMNIVSTNRELSINEL